MKTHLRLMVLAVAILLAQWGYSQPLSGTLVVGPAPSNYTSLALAFSALNTKGINGPVVIELTSNYVPDASTVTIGAITGSSTTNTITIRPQAGVSSITLAPATGSVFILNGVDNLIIDGRPGGVGTTKALFLQASSLGAAAITTFSDVENFTLRYCTLQANANTLYSGVVTVNASTSGIGCDNMTITNCTFDGYGSNNGLFVLGSSIAITDNLVITDNVFSNIYAPTNLTTAHNGIHVMAFVNGVQISGNVLNNDVNSNYNCNPAAYCSGIKVGGQVTKVSIANNIIGGTNATGGGSPSTFLGKINYRAIDVTTVVSDTIRINGNKIANIVVQTDTCSSGGQVFTGINVFGNGSVEMGTTAPNVIGRDNLGGSIRVNLNTVVTPGQVMGINISCGGFLNLQNNKIGGFSISGGTVNVVMAFSGIIAVASNAVATHWRCSNNVVGSTTNSNNIIATCGMPTSSLFGIRGIYVLFDATSSVPECFVENNIVSNLTHEPGNGDGANVVLQGILAATVSATNGNFIITGNTVSKITGASIRTDNRTAMALTGIMLQTNSSAASALVPVISNNRITGLTNTGILYGNGFVAYVSGIFVYTVNTNAASVLCEKNIIQGLNVTNTNTLSAPIVSGIHTCRNMTAVNNVIRLGLTSSGQSIMSPIGFRGFFKAANVSTNFSHNTVYVAGLPVADGNFASTSAYYALSAANDTIANNILINKRSNQNTSSTNRHHLINTSSTLLSYIGYNLYYANGTGGAVGTVNSGSSMQLLMGDWRKAQPADVYSTYADVPLTNPAGDETYFNLKPPISENLFCAPIAQVTNDITNISRGTIPTAGAYELTTKLGVWKATAPNDNWNTGSNWESGFAPTNSGSNIFIPAGTVNLPSIPDGVTIGRLVNATSQNITVGNNVSIAIRGDLVQGSTSSVMNANNATITFNGVEHQTISGILNVGNLGINNSSTGVSINGKVNVSNTLTPSAGNLIANGNLTFVSNATGTAIIGPGFGSITGDVIVQRFLPAKAARKSLFLGSPVTARIDTSWQRQIHITGAVGACPAVSSGGFDVTSTGNPSMFTYNASNITGQRWVGIANTIATNLIPGRGYRVVVRGDRSAGCTLLDGSAQAASAVTLQAKGLLNQADVNVTINEGFNFLANPYQSPIDFFQLAAGNSGMAMSYWIYNPENNNGVYSVYNSGTLTNKPAGYINDRYIAPGQAFFMQKITTGSATITSFFRTQHRVTTAQTGLFRTQTWPGMVRVHLRSDTGARIDEAVIRFGSLADISNTVAGTYDALNISEGAEGISSIKAGAGYSIQTRTAVTQTDTVSLKVTSNKVGTYQLYFKELQLGNQQAILIDKFLNQQQTIRQDDVYTFAITADAASKNNRFDIVFRSQAVPAVVTANSKLNIYPNPVQQQLNVQFDERVKGQLVATITDSKGQTIYRKEGFNLTASNLLSLQVAFLPKGSYQLLVTNGADYTATASFVKQ